MHGESFILNDEDEKVYAGVRYQENRDGEMKPILFFLRPDTCHLLLHPLR